MEKRVNFAVVKEKIIKTDELLAFYEDKNTKLIKLSHAYKEAKSKYETAVAEINRLRMENERLSFNLESIKPKFEQNELELYELREDHARLDEKYQQILINSQSHYKSLKEKIDNCNCDKDISSSPKNSKSQSELKEEEKVFKERIKELQQQENKIKKENAALILKNKELVEGFEKERKKHAEDIQHLQIRNDNLQKEIDKLKAKMQHSKHNVEKTTKLELVISSLECEKDFEVKKLEKQVRRLSVDRNEMQRLKNEYEDLKKQISPQKKDCQVQTEPKISVEHSQCVRKIDFEENNVVKEKIDHAFDLDYHESVQTGGYSSEDSEIYREFCANRLAFDRRIVKGINLSPMSTSSEQHGVLACLSPINELPEAATSIPNIMVTPPTPVIMERKDLVFNTFKKISSTPDKKQILRNVREKELSSTPSTIRPRRRKFIMPFQNNFIPTRKMRQNSRNKQKANVGHDSILEALKALQACNISFTISNDTNSRYSAQNSQVIKEDNVSPKVENLVKEKINCWSDRTCAQDKNGMLIKSSSGGKSELVGFFDVKDESVAPNSNIIQKLISGIEKLVKFGQNESKVGQGKRRRRRNEADFRTETETEIERLFVGERDDVLARNRLLLEAALRERCPDEESDFLGDSGLVSPGTSSSFVRGTPDGFLSKLSDHPSLTSELIESRNSNIMKVSEVDQRSVRSLESHTVRSDIDSLLLASKSLEKLVQQSKLQSTESSEIDLKECSSQNNQISECEFNKPDSLTLDTNNQDHVSGMQTSDFKEFNTKINTTSNESLISLESRTNNSDSYQERSFNSPDSLSEVPLDPPPNLEENSVDKVIKEDSLNKEKQDSLEQQQDNELLVTSDSNAKTIVDEKKPLKLNSVQTLKKESEGKDAVLCKSTNLEVRKSAVENNKPTPESSLDESWTKASDDINKNILTLSTQKKLVVLISEKNISPEKINKTFTTTISPPTESSLKEIKTPSKLDKPCIVQGLINSDATQSTSLKLLDLPESSQKIVQRIRLDSNSSTKSEFINASPTFRLKNKRRITSDSDDDTNLEKKCPPKRKKRSYKRKSPRLNKQLTVSESENDEQVQPRPCIKHNLRNRKSNQKLRETINEISSSENLTLNVLAQKLKEKEHANETIDEEYVTKRTKKVGITRQSTENRRRLKLRSDDNKVKSKEFLSDSIDSSSEDNHNFDKSLKDSDQMTHAENRLCPDNLLEKYKSHDVIKMRTRKYSLRSDDKKSTLLSSSRGDDDKSLALYENRVQPEVSCIDRESRTRGSRKLSDNTHNSDNSTKIVICQEDVLSLCENRLQPECVEQELSPRKTRRRKSLHRACDCDDSGRKTSHKNDEKFLENKLKLDLSQTATITKTRTRKSLDQTNEKEVPHLNTSCREDNNSFVLSPKGQLQKVEGIEHATTPRQRSRSVSEGKVGEEGQSVHLRSDDKKSSEISKHISAESKSKQHKNENRNTDPKQSSIKHLESISNNDIDKDAFQLKQVLKSDNPASREISFEKTDIMTSKNIFKEPTLNRTENSILPKIKNIEADTKSKKYFPEVLIDHNYCSSPEYKQNNELPFAKTIILSVKPTNTNNRKNFINMHNVGKEGVKAEVFLNKDLPALQNNNNGYVNLTTVLNKCSVTPNVLKTNIPKNLQLCVNPNSSDNMGNQIKGTIRNRIPSETIESESEGIKSSSPSKKLTVRIIQHLNSNDSVLANYLKDTLKDKEHGFTESECESVKSCSSGSFSTPKKIKSNILWHLEAPENSGSNEIKKKHPSVRDLFGDSSEYDSKSNRRKSTSSDNNNKGSTSNVNLKARILSVQKSDVNLKSREIKSEKSLEHDLFGELSDSVEESDNDSANSSLLLESAIGSLNCKKPKGTLRAKILGQVKSCKNRAKMKTESCDNISKLPILRPMDRIQESKITIVQDIRISREGLIIDLDNLALNNQTIDVKPKIEPKSEIEECSPVKMEEHISWPTCREVDVKNKLDLKSEHIAPIKEKIKRPPRKKSKLEQTDTATDIVSKVLQDMIKSKLKPKTVQNAFKTINNPTNHRNHLNKSTELKKIFKVEKTEVDSSLDDYDCPKSPDVLETPDVDCLPKIIPTEKPKVMAGSRVRVLFNKLMIYSREENVVDEILAAFATQEDTYIADIIVQKVAQDFQDKADNAHAPAPPLTSTQRVLLGFMARLARSSHPNIYDKFLAAAEMQLFDRLRCTLKMVAPVTRLYTAVCKLRKDINRIRRFCCEGFYFMEDFALPMFFIVLTMWADVLPMEVQRTEYPQAKVLVQLCYLKDCNQPGYNLMPLRDLLIKFFGYPTERWNCDEVFQEALIQYLRNPALRLSDFTLLLFLKNKPTKWVYQKMRENIMPLVETIPQENCNLKATLMILLGNICRNFNKFEDYDWTVITEMKEWFRNWDKDNTQPILKRSIQLVMSRLPSKPKNKQKGATDNSQDTKIIPENSYVDLDAPQGVLSQSVGSSENLPESSCKRQKMSYKGVANDLADLETSQEKEKKKD